MKVGETGQEEYMARLLVVDDEKSICQVLEIAFRKEGHAVETVTSGQHAKRKIESAAYDAIIADIRMPDLTGIELLITPATCTVLLRLF